MVPVWPTLVEKVYHTSSLPEVFAQKAPDTITGADMVAPVVTTAVVAAHEPFGFMVIPRAPGQSLLAGWPHTAVALVPITKKASRRKMFVKFFISER